jgi:CheY-like chemotaxis protein
MAPLVPVRRAMVVEDEWLVRMEIADALAEAGWDVFEAASGEEALATLGVELRMDLLVTDIRLLGTMTGWDVAEAFRQAVQDIPVIYASANSALQARQVSGSVFIGKPTLIPHLIATSEMLWRTASKPSP